MDDIDQLISDCSSLDPARLRSTLIELAASERRRLVELLIHLARYDLEDLYKEDAYPTPFAYCTRVLGYSEHAAYKRIYAARAARRFPVIYRLLARGDLHLSAVVMLAPHLTAKNHDALLKSACRKTKLELQWIVAAAAPRAATRDCIRRAFDTSALAPEIHPPEYDRFRPLAPGLVHFAFTGREETFQLFRRAQEVLRHRFPHARADEILNEALNTLLERKDPDRIARRRELRAARRTPPVARPTGRDRSIPDSRESRRIPTSVKHAVRLRDEGRCAFKAADGTRCESRSWLEYDHIVPWALGGRSDDVGNIRLLCRAHNQHLGRRTFGGPARVDVEEAAAPD